MEGPTEAIAQNNTITILNLSNNNAYFFRYETTDELANNKSIIVLDASGTLFKDINIKAFAKSHVIALSLQNTQTSDETVETLLQNKSLLALSVDNTQISDANKTRLAQQIAENQRTWPWHFAILNNDQAALAKLINDNPTGINKINKNGQSPLLIAAQLQNKEMAFLLLAQPNILLDKNQSSD